MTQDQNRDQEPRTIKDGRFLLSNKTAITWAIGFFGLAIILTIAWVIFGIASGDDEPKTPPGTTTEEVVARVPTCENLEKKYAVITLGTFPGDTLRVGPEQTWVFRLDREEWIGWITADVKSWSVPTDSNEVRFPNGLVIIETPENTRQISYPSNTYGVRGKGCRLMTTKRTLAASLGLL